MKKLLSIFLLTSISAFVCAAELTDIEFGVTPYKAAEAIINEAKYFGVKSKYLNFTYKHSKIDRDFYQELYNLYSIYCAKVLQNNNCDSTLFMIDNKDSAYLNIEVKNKFGFELDDLAGVEILKAVGSQKNINEYLHYIFYAYQQMPLQPSSYRSLLTKLLFQIDKSALDQKELVSSADKKLSHNFFKMMLDKIAQAYPYNDVIDIGKDLKKFNLQIFADYLVQQKELLDKELLTKIDNLAGGLHDIAS